MDFYQRERRGLFTPFDAIILIFLIVTVLYGGRWLAIHSIEWRYHLRAVPGKIQVRNNIIVEDCSFSGGAIYTVSSRTIAEMHQEGIDFFKDALQARGHAGDFHYKYQQWQETPVPDEWLLGDGQLSFSFACILGTKKTEMFRIIHEAMAKKGAFYTRSESMGLQIIVIPDLDLLVLTYQKV